MKIVPDAVSSLSAFHCFDTVDWVNKGT